MRRFSLWLRDKPIVADSILAFVLALFEVAVVAPQSRQPWSFAAAGVLLSMPLVFRRRYPLAMAATMLALSVTTSIVQSWSEQDKVGHIVLIGLGFFLYTLVAYVGRREAAIYLVGLVIDAVLGYYLVDHDQAILGIVPLYYALCWTSAEFIGARRAYDAEVEARLAVADYDRERSAHEAVAVERTRIARELHDVVAHAVSVMIVQADGASYAMRRDPDTAERALANISSTGRQALHELRRTVALLRTEHAPEQLPQHGTAGIANVVQLMRTAGLAVELEQTGPLDDMSPQVGLGVHRIVQESLTNTLRHAGLAPKAWVRVKHRGPDVLVEITDTGPGKRTGTTVSDQSTPAPIQGGGLGLVGMRERIAVLNGTLEAGPMPDGRWRVTAVIPVQSD